MPFNNIDPLQTVGSIQYGHDFEQRMTLARLHEERAGNPSYIARFVVDKPTAEVYADDYLVQIGKLAALKAVDTADSDPFINGGSIKDVLANLFGFGMRKDVELIPLLQRKPKKRRAENYNLAKDSTFVISTGQGLFTEYRVGAGYILPSSYETPAG